MSERVACLICERVFPDIEAMERHERKKHAKEIEASNYANEVARKARESAGGVDLTGPDVAESSES